MEVCHFLIIYQMHPKSEALLNESNLRNYFIFTILDFYFINL